MPPNHSETTSSVWFYCKDKALNFNADIGNNNAFKSFKCKAKRLKDTFDVRKNEILENAAIAVPLKYLITFWRSLEF